MRGDAKRAADPARDEKVSSALAALRVPQLCEPRVRDCRRSGRERRQRKKQRRRERRKAGA
eukprot:152456-Rhodomonas_salina.3